MTFCSVDLINVAEIYLFFLSPQTLQTEGSEFIQMFVFHFLCKEKKVQVTESTTGTVV